MKKERKNGQSRNLEFDIEQEIKKLNDVSGEFSKFEKEIQEIQGNFPADAAERMQQEQIGQLSQELHNMKEQMCNVQRNIAREEHKVHNICKEIQRFHKKISAWKVAAVAELIGLIVLGTAFLVYGMLKNQESIPADQKLPNGNIASNEEEVPPEAKTSFYASDLKEKVAKLSRDDIMPFEASVEEIDGMETLCLTYQDLKICYANEYPEGEGDAKKIRLQTEERLAVYRWDYDLTGDLLDLVPEYGAYTGEEGYQLIFMHYEDGNENFPTTLRMLDANKLWDYDNFNLQQALAGQFLLEYPEALSGADGAASETRMKLTVNSVEYQYAISKDTYTDAVYYGEDILCFDQYFTLEMDEEKMSFQAVVYTPNKEYLGEINGEIAAVDRQIVLKNVRFGAYVTPYQEDATSNGIIVPRGSRMVEYITISGKNRERFYIELSDEIERVAYDMERLVQNENGFFEYFDENGEKISFQGIDVSKYQGDIDWKKVKGAGVDFAILRLGYRGMGEGTLEMDPYYEANIKGATEAGVKVGVYFFSQAITVKEAVEEAEMVLEHIQGYDITYPVIFDTEAVTTHAARANNIPRDLRTEICKAFCDTIAAAGYRPMIYANTRWMILGIDLEKLTEYDKWYAYYGTTFTFPYQYQMLQYSDSGSIPGINGAVDLDISFVDYSLQE